MPRRRAKCPLLLALALAACDAPPSSTPPDAGVRPPRAELPELAAEVNPFVGTGGAGHVFLGAAEPHGMVKLGPDTDNGGGSILGYAYESERIQGFAHTHLSGPGGEGYGYGHVLVMPGLGAPATSDEARAAPFRHETEEASPARYAVTLEGAAPIRAELTATAHGGVHRYTFPAAPDAHVAIDLVHSRGQSAGGHVEIVGDDLVRGTGVYQVWPLVSLLLRGFAEEPTTGVATVHFAARFSRPFDAAGTWARGRPSDAKAADGPGIGAWASFATGEGEAIELRVGISLISVEQAEANLAVELEGRTFAEVEAATRARWNELLSRVQVRGGTDLDRRRLYTALYHALLQPADYTEDGRFFIGADGVGEVASDGGRYFTDNWCLWDTAKTTHPLLTLVEPEVVGDMVQSLVRHYERAGWISKCTWNATGDSRTMTANHAFCVIADAHAKGLTGFDAETAWEAVYKGSTEDNDEQNPLLDGTCGYFNQGTPRHYVEAGFVPKECDVTQGASMTLEHAYNDSCVARFAEGLGRVEDAAAFAARSGSWRNVWNPEHGFMQLRAEDGAWNEPFDPESPVGFTEANAWIYTWHVQHDPCGLIDAMGGAEAFSAKLDAFFGEGHFDMGNEPDFHAPWLFQDAGRPERTQEVLGALLADRFRDAPDGLPGNDDAGATSAWLAFALLGLYPLAPGDPIYRVHAPVFDEVTLLLEPAFADGRTFTLRATRARPGDAYVQSATLDGAPLDRPVLAHADIAAGGTLELTLGAAPGAWGAQGLCP